jgi:hypothetical protein
MHAATWRERDRQNSKKRVCGEVSAESAPKKSPLDARTRTSAVTAGKYGDIIL